MYLQGGQSKVDAHGLLSDRQATFRQTCPRAQRRSGVETADTQAFMVSWALTVSEKRVAPSSHAVFQSRRGARSLAEIERNHGLAILCRQGCSGARPVRHMKLSASRGQQQPAALQAELVQSGEASKWIPEPHACNLCPSCWTWRRSRYMHNLHWAMSITIYRIRYHSMAWQ